MGIQLHRLPIITVTTSHESPIGYLIKSIYIFFILNYLIFCAFRVFLTPDLDI